MDMAFNIMHSKTMIFKLYIPEVICPRLKLLIFQQLKFDNSGLPLPVARMECCIKFERVF